MKNFICIGKKLFKVNFLVLVLVYLVVCNSGIVLAEDATSSSKNYEITGQTDYSGGYSESENYQVEGIMTDIKDVSALPEEEIAAPVVPIPEEPAPPFKNIIDYIKDFLESPLARNLLSTLTWAGAILGAVSVLANAIMNAQWLSLISQFFARIWYFLGWSKKRYRWGRVYDAESQVPIAGAVVTIFDSAKKKALATDISNAEGRYGFIVKPGLYYMQVTKANYLFPSHIAMKDYHREVFEIKEENEVITDLNIPIDPDIEKLGGKLHIIQGILNFLNAIRIPVLVFGTILSIAFLIYYKTIYDWLIFILYMILWAIEIYQLRKIKNYGIVKGKEENLPLPQTIIRVFDQKISRLIATKVTGGNGKYFYNVNPGEYSLNATKIGYDQYKIENIKCKKGDVIKKDIYLNKNINNNS